MTAELQRSVLLTSTGRARLQEELDRLLRKHEPETRERLRDLRDGGNPEDQDLRLALEDLARVQQRIREVEQLLATEPAEDAPYTPGAITIGSRVLARDGSGRMHTFVLVSPLEAGAVRGHVSTASPVGVALLGRRPGDQVQVTVPAGLRALTVLSVE
ncbi:MAG: GreA/GreB family elongation factor [Dehalococcoidia bacterium]